MLEAPELRDCTGRLCRCGSMAGQIYARTGAEQWAVNANVHYNNWSNFTATDFRPVVEAFPDVHGLFWRVKLSAP